MKYKLKKDLPFADKGARVRIFCGSSMITMSFQTLNDEKVVDINLQCEEQIPILVNMGWIEEVKPRLFFIELFKDSGKISDASFDPTILREDARFTIVKAMETL